MALGDTDGRASTTLFGCFTPIRESVDMVGYNPTVEEGSYAIMTRSCRIGSCMPGRLVPEITKHEGGEE